MSQNIALSPVQALAPLYLARYEIRLRTLDTIRLPGYKGSVFRGALGHALKQVVCVMEHRDCHRCLLRETCVYSICFESPTPLGATVLRKNSHRPHPFVLEPPLEEKSEYVPGEHLILGLVLIGLATTYLPYFIVAINKMGGNGIGTGRGRFMVEEVIAVTTQGRVVVYTGGSETLGQVPPPLTIDGLILALDETILRIQVRFLTPTRLRSNGHFIDRIQFAALFSRLLDRLSSLTRFYCGAALALDFQAEKDAARDVRTVESRLEWFDWERYSARQGSRMTLGGVKGEVVFEGPLGRFLPYLRLGEHIHVGNGTAFGLGAFRLMDDV